MASEDRPIVFYDGHCGLCHRWVKFVVPRDPAGRFRFAPLQGDTVAELLDEPTRAALPDSIVLRDPDGVLRYKSEAVLAILRGLGGGWWALAELMGVIPWPIRDLGYDMVARVRHRVFKRPEEACPLMPAELRDRFLA